MEGSFTVQLFDLLVYLLPGLILLLAFSLFCESGLSAKIIASEAKFAIIYILLFSFFAGVLMHIASTGGMALYRRLVHRNYIHEVINTFEDRENVRKIVSEKIHANIQGGDVLYEDDLMYRYAEIMVHEKAPYHGATISRLMALSIFCRNSIIPVAILAIALFLRFQKSRRWYQWLLLSLIVLSVEFLLVQGMASYRATAARLILRAFITLYASS